MRAMDARQRGQIFAISSALGLTGGGRDDELHVLIYGLTGKESIKALNREDAEKVIRRLKELQGPHTAPEKSGKEYRKKEKKHVPGGVSAGQERKVWALMYALKEYDKKESPASLGKRLSAIIKKELKIDATEKAPLQWLDFRKGNTLIEILKKYIEREEKKARAGDGSS